MSVNLTIPQRYLPIQDHQIPSSLLITSTQRGGNISEATLTSGASGGFYQDLSIFISLAILILIAVITIVYIIATTSIPRISSSAAEIVRGISGDGGGVEQYSGYSYQGIKLVLRKIYLSLRRSSKCEGCTPRELALKGYAPIDFADTYEDIVYGGVERADIDPILGRVREILGEGNG